MRRLALLLQRAGTWRSLLLLLAILLVAACEDGHGLTGAVEPVTTPVPTVTGTVISSLSRDPVAGAIVSVGPATATTGPDGRFELAGLTPGPATLRGIADGFEDFEADITVPSGGITRVISLTSVAPLLIHADVRPRDVIIAVYQGGTRVEDALVTVNGWAIPPLRGSGSYRGQHPVHAGSPLELEVTAHGKTVKATANVPETPVLTAPAAGSVFALTDSITFAWTSAADPDSFVVTVGVGFTFDISVPGNARDLKMTANIGAFSVRAFKTFSRGSFTGPADPDSRINIWGDSADVAITIRSQVAVGSLSINPPMFGMSVGETAKLTVTVLDLLGREIPNASGTFRSDHENVANVDETGLVNAVALGGATISATSDGVSATTIVLVRSYDFPYVLPVKIDPAEATISVGESVQLTATVLDPRNGEGIPVCRLRQQCTSDTVVLS